MNKEKKRNSLLQRHQKAVYYKWRSYKMFEKYCAQIEKINIQLARLNNK